MHFYLICVCMAIISEMVSIHSVYAQLWDQNNVSVSSVYSGLFLTCAVCIILFLSILYVEFCVSISIHSKLRDFHFHVIVENIASMDRLTLFSKHSEQSMCSGRSLLLLHSLPLWEAKQSFRPHSLSLNNLKHWVVFPVSRSLIPPITSMGKYIYLK